eukprot:6309787-Pyramimonas_sp.AAC.1
MEIFGKTGLPAPRLPSLAATVPVQVPCSTATSPAWATSAGSTSVVDRTTTSGSSRRTSLQL